MFYMKNECPMYGDQRLLESLSIVSNVFACQFTAPSMAKYVKNKINEYAWSLNKYLDSICGDSDLCHHPCFVQEACRRAKLHVVKTIRLNIRHLTLLLDQFPTLKVLYLVRDPRGIMNSRKDREWCDEEICQNVSILCSTMLQDINNFKELRNQYSSRLFIYRYEDLALNVFTNAKKLYELLGIPYSKEVINFLNTHTRLDFETVKKSRNPHSTYRNSDAVALHWVKKMPLKDIFRIQKNCAEVISLLGYPTIISQRDKKAFTIEEFVL